MTDYTKSTNFASKDSLISGNPLKIVKGTEIDTEFNNIATAIATKADLASPALTGIPTAPTASVPTNTTQIATTAFAMQAAYPVGSVYMNASDSTNPATLFGFGTWNALGAGRMLIGAGTNDGQTFIAESVGGDYAPSMPSHTHTATDSGHTHTMYARPLGGSPTTPTYLMADSATSGTAHNPITDSSTANITVASTSSGDTTTGNLPPYLTVYMWKRTA